MRSAAVNEVWEFYRDNCPGFKEPMRKKLRKLDEYVSRLEATPKEATPERETCRINYDRECSQCGASIHEHANMYWAQVGDGMWTVKHREVRFCPNCGRRVEQ